MKNLPPIVAQILTDYLSVILSWCSDYLYERLRPYWRDEPLLRWQALLDFGPIEQACAPYHKQVTGKPGRPISHSVPKLVRVLFLMVVHAPCSYRQAESRLRSDLLWRTFAGYGLFEEVPDHNTIYLFDKYVGQHHPRLYFDTVLRQIDELLPQERARPQIADTFAMLANAALEGPTARLRHLTSRLLRALDKVEPTAYETITTDMESLFEEGRLFGWEEVEHPFYWSQERRQQRRQETVIEALLCRELVRPYEADNPRLAEEAAYLDKMIADEFHLTRDEQDKVVAAVLLPAEKRGKFRICSGTDPEASIRNHGPDKRDFGFNAAVAATDSGIIREIAAHTGSTGDVTTIPGLLQAQQEHHDLLPSTLSFDQIAGTGKTAAAVHEVSQGQTRLVAKPKPSHADDDDKFTPQDCTLSDDGLALTCPGGQTSRRRYRKEQWGWFFRFIAAQCLGCPLLERCRGSQERPTTHRDFFISHHMSFFLALLAHSQTNQFRLDMQKRPRIELVIAHLVLFHGLRRARFRGLAKVDYQMKMGAMAYNAKRLLSLLAAKKREQAPSGVATVTLPGRTLSPA